MDHRDNRLNRWEEGARGVLTHCHVAVWGGDRRQLEVIEQLVQNDATVSLVGFDAVSWPEGVVQIHQPDGLEGATVDALVLPVSGVQPDGQVEATYAQQPLYLYREHLLHFRPSTVVYTGIASMTLLRLCQEASLRCVPLLDRDDVAIYNSIPTAEGLVQLVIEQTEHTIHGACVVVLGFGRTGMTICRTFSALGAHVVVGVHTAEQRARAIEMGLHTFDPLIEEVLCAQVSQAEVIINTVPAPLMTADVLAHVRTQSFIVDIASDPGGVDFRYAQKRQLHARRAPGLPGVCAPKTAGKIIAAALLTLLRQQMLRSSL